MVPLTHQLVQEDRELVAALHKNPTTRGKIPLVLGGHDHEIFEVAAPRKKALGLGAALAVDRSEERKGRGGHTSRWEPGTAAEGSQNPSRPCFFPLPSRMPPPPRPSSRSAEVQVVDEGGTILKVGQDALTIGVVDLWWTCDGDLQSSYALVPSALFAPDEGLSAMVDTPPCNSAPPRHHRDTVFVSMYPMPAGQREGCYVGHNEGGGDLQPSKANELKGCQE